MQEIRTYNHSKPKDSTDRVSFFYIAAKISLLGPILCGILLRGAAYGLKDMHYGVLVLTVGGLLTVVVNLVCFALGLVALFGVVKYGMHGILIRAVLGLLLSGLSLGLFGAGFVRGFQAALKQHQFMARARATPDQPGNENGGALPGGGDSTNINSSGKETADASAETGNRGSTAGNATKAHNGPADTTAAGKALASFQAQEQSLATAYDDAALALKTPPVLSMKSMTSREQLTARKGLVLKFLDANEKWLGFNTKAEVTFREEMVKLHATTATIDAGIKDYRQSTADREFALIRIRSTDHRVGTATLNMLTILEGNWGHWKYNADKNTLSFGDSAIAAQYNDNLADLNDAKAEQARLQAELSRSTESTPPLEQPAK